MAAMEMGEQREDFEISRRNPSLLEAHVVKNSFLTQTQNPTPLSKPPDPGTGAASSLNMAVSASVGNPKSILTEDGNSSLAGSKSFHSLIRDMCKEYSASFIILLETHVSGIKGKNIRDKNRLNGSFMVEATGHSGNIWCLWDDRIWNVCVLEHNNQLVHLKVSCNNFDFWLISAFRNGPDLNRGRRPFRFLAAWLSHPDFNNLIHQSSRMESSWSEGLAWPDILQNYIWRIGYGTEISFWKHNWVPNLGKLEQYVTQDVVKKIAAISLPSPWKMSDQVAWNLSSDGSFNFKLSYQALCTNQPPLNDTFDLIWHWRGSVEHISTYNAKHDRPICWTPPNKGVVKLNVDGSFLVSINNAACGGIVRNHLSGFVKGFFCNLESYSIMYAELWDIIHRFKIASNLTQSIVIVESDLTALKFIFHGCPTGHLCSSLVEEIKLHANRIPQVY
ncbi:hypothetical protein Ahy_B05g075828 isoform A [Arachis hypogaea]|uniref:RNase H type-1 domain-containing protein n=1 Tax=Arachis hypogaea TaxID=3818 RepID=A0A444Z228_ARAHY|nr:hypothetical protein Ahy_B05g075828 isoform A [Arachis hypogaea]